MKNIVSFYSNIRPIGGCLDYGLPDRLPKRYYDDTYIRIII